MHPTPMTVYYSAVQVIVLCTYDLKCTFNFSKLSKVSAILNKCFIKFLLVLCKICSKFSIKNGQCSSEFSSNFVISLNFNEN